MSKNILRFVVGFVTILLVVTPVFAGQIHFNTTFKLGSLIAFGTVAGIGNTDVLSTLAASGIPEVICQNQGGNQAPGQNPPRLFASGSNFLPGTDLARKNGKAPYSDEATWNNDEVLVAPGALWGCPNDNWTAYVYPDRIYWDTATLTFSNANTGEILASQKYSCVTTLGIDIEHSSVSCKRVP
jgi:hypothetical protein